MTHRETIRNELSQGRESSRVFRILLSMVCAWCVSACATSRPSDSDLKWLQETSNLTSDEATSGRGKMENQDDTHESLVARPGNFITLSSLEDSSLNGRFRVRLDGVVELPYGKRLKAAGMSASALQQKIRNLYRSYFKNDDVEIGVRISDREVLVEVRGLVAKPGRYSIDRSTSLDEVLGKAGGFSGSDRRPGIALIRKGEIETYFNLNAYYESGSGGVLPRWVGGEVIIFLNDLGPGKTNSTAPTVRLLGEVRAPGEFTFVPGADIYHYFSIAGGPTVYSDQNEIELVRGADHERRSVRLKMGEFSKYVRIKSGDVIIIHANQPTPFERRVQVSAGVASVLSTLILILVTIF